MDFKFVDANTIKSKFLAKSVKREKTIEDARASIANTLLKMLDGTRKNKKGEVISTTNRVLRKGTGNNYDFQVLYGTVRVFGGELTAISEAQAKEKLKTFAEEIRTGKGLAPQVNTAIKSAMDKVKERGEKAAAKRKATTKK